jgi:hypothetical protein
MKKRNQYPKLYTFLLPPIKVAVCQPISLKILIPINLLTFPNTSNNNLYNNNTLSLIINNLNLNYMYNPLRDPLSPTES